MFLEAWIIAKKEIRLLFKSTRRILLLFSMPLVILFIFAASIFIVGVMPDSMDSRIEVTVINDDTGFNNQNWGNNFYALLKSMSNTKSYDYTNETIDNLDSLLEEGNFEILIYIPANFSQIINQSSVEQPSIIFIYYDNSNTKNEEAVLNISFATSTINQLVIYDNYGLINLNRVSINPTGTSKGAGALIASLMTMIPLYLIIFLVIPPLTLVLISVTIEREQKTLESLLLQPIDRKNIVAGKMLYGIILVSFNIVANLIAASIALALTFFTVIPEDDRNEITSIGQTIIAETGFSVWFFLIWFILGLILVSIIVIAAAVLFSLMAKDEREANMVISSVIILPLLGSLLIMFVPIGDLPGLIQYLLVGIPLLGYLFAVYLSFLAGEIPIVSWVSLLFQFLWIVIIVWLAGRLIESEGILEISFKRMFSRKKITSFLLRK